MGEFRRGGRIRWTGYEYREPETGLSVVAGEVGELIDFEGDAVDAENLVVTFPSVGAFVCRRDQVEPVNE